MPLFIYIYTTFQAFLVDGNRNIVRSWFLTSMTVEGDLNSAEALFFPHLCRFVKMIFYFFSTLLSGDVHGVVGQNLSQIMGLFKNIMTNVIKTSPEKCAYTFRTCL